MKELGNLHYFLGIQVKSNHNGLFLTEQKYAKDLLLLGGMNDCSPMPSPLPSQLDKINGQDEKFEDPTYFRSLAGKLQYLTLTRPDIQYSVNFVCQKMHSPSVSDFILLKRVLRYVKGTSYLGVSFSKDTDCTLRGYSDSDWAGCKESRRSTGGYCTFLGKNIISWSAKKQPTVSRSSTEAEYRALASTAAEITWISAVLRDLYIPQLSPAEIYCDNLSSVYLSTNPTLHSRTKHIDVDYHYVREKVALGSLVIKHVSAEHQLADIFTKPLPIQPFQSLRFKLGVASPPYLSLRGNVKHVTMMKENKGDKVQKDKVQVEKGKAQTKMQPIYQTKEKKSMEQRSMPANTGDKTRVGAEEAKSNSTTEVIDPNNRFGILGISNDENM